MGSNQSVAMMAGTMNADTYRRDCESTHRVVGKAFDKCIGEMKTDSKHELSGEERACIEEYALMYTNYLKTGFQTYGRHYEQHQREMYEKARMQQMMQQGQQDVREMRMQ